ncbi:DUF1996 domain-containing protein [Kibdelosporangium aridum]|uniref:DUF1996 domain-containing protein n=1 Tax=Kibdelosporangium aridum TaxID=2030 RepID=UPI000526835F
MPAQTLQMPGWKRFRRRLMAAVAVTPLVLVVTLLTTQSPTGHSAHALTLDAGPVVPFAASEFRANCLSSHRAGNDPIVFPNQPNVSHIHEFFGNRTTNAHSTLKSLRSGTTNCQPTADLSAYWVPTLYKNGVPIAPESVIIYYQGIHNAPQAVAPPQGLRIVVGNATAATADQNPAARWSCVGHGASSRDFMNCPPGSKLETYLDFPTCWNGRDLDSPNHKDHMAFAPGLVCPPTHPVVLPRTEFLITYTVNGTGLTLAGTRNGTNVTTAPGFTFHGDFMNAWDPAELERRMRDCIRAQRICGTNGNPI